jgi:hypothetical protein
METYVADVVEKVSGATPETTRGTRMLPKDVARFRLGVWTSCGPSDGPSLSRVEGPFHAMRREDARLEIVRPPRNPDGSVDLDWSFFTGLDAMYFLDPFSQQHLAMIALAKACGCKVWVDYIDDLTNVPASNPQFKHYARGDVVRAGLEQIIGMADICTTTTLTLKQRFPKRDRIVILPESCRWPQCPLPRERVVTWRGSPSHAEDIESVLPQISHVARMPQFSKWRWVFLGFDEVDWRIARAFPNAKEQLEFVPWLPPYDFMNTWGGFAPYLHLAPLVDSAFNRGKTPLAWLEATAIGAATIGPALAEWNGCDGLIRYNTAEEFGDILKREMFTFKDPVSGATPETTRGTRVIPGNFHPKAVESRAAVYPGKTLEAVNVYRWMILRKLATKVQTSTSKPQVD